MELNPLFVQQTIKVCNHLGLPLDSFKYFPRRQFCEIFRLKKKIILECAECNNPERDSEVLRTLPNPCLGNKGISPLACFNL